MEAGTTAPCEVRFPDGTKLSLPFGRRDEALPSRLDLGSEPVPLDVVLKVRVDNVIKEWWDEPSYTEGDSEFVGIGYIKLWVTLGSKYAEMRFHGASGDVSTILWDSPAIHDELLGVLREAAGLAAAIISDDGRARLLSNTKGELPINWDWVNSSDGDTDPEKLAQEVIRQVQNLSQ
jgi:hypothetical protein